MLTKEDYVSLETAKMLKEKGFNDETSAYYGDNRGLVINQVTKANNNLCAMGYISGNFKLEFEDFIAAAPTLYEAQQWILSRGLYVCPKIYENKGWYYTINKVKSGELLHSYLSIAKDLFISLSQALDAGIRKASELIKEE